MDCESHRTHIEGDGVMGFNKRMYEVYIGQTKVASDVSRKVAIEIYYRFKQTHGTEVTLIQQN